VRVNWEHLVEDPVWEVFNSHLRMNLSHFPREVGDMESEWTMFKDSMVDVVDRFLSWRQPEGSLPGLVGPEVS